MIPRNKMDIRLTIILVLAFNAHYSEQYGSGAPEVACQNMLPTHRGTSPQTSPPPYTVTASASQVKQGSGIDITISSPIGTHVKGFLLQARTAQDPNVILGDWSNLPTDTRLSNCTSNGDSVTHSSPNVKPNLTFRWNAPKAFLGSVLFRATVAQEYDSFWLKVDSTLIEVVTPDTIIPTNKPPTATTLVTDTKIPAETTTATTVQPNNPFYEGCGSTKLCFGSTPTCLDTKNCETAVTVTVRGDIYTFELFGSGNAAYVGVGLSSDRLMGFDSVMECQQRDSRTVTVHTSWTYPKSDPFVSRQNVSQSIVQPISTSLVNGNIHCRFTRDTRSIVRDVEFDLVKDKYHLLLVSGTSVKGDHVGFHDKLSISSEAKISLSEIDELRGASKLLLRLHGAFMLIAWIGTASCGILLARYYRQTWVGKQLGGKDIWFAWHRIFMVLTWTLTIAAFIIILIEVGGWTGTGDNPHAIIGIVTIILCFLQPIGAYFRPHPNTAKRPIFNWVHWLFGNAAHILGIVTIFFAVSLNKAELPGWMIWILVAFVAFHVIMHIILSITLCVSDGRMNNGRVNSIPMKDFLPNARSTINQDIKTDAPHSGFRKFLLGLYFVVIILFVVVLVCLISLAPIEETYESVSKAISGGKNDTK